MKSSSEKSASEQSASQERSTGEFITLARVVKTQGRRGEVAAEVHSDVPGRFSQSMRLWALLGEAGSSERKELEVEEFWPHKAFLILKFRGVDSISDAEALVGCELQVPRADRAHLDPGWNYVSDLIGCLILDQGIEIGHIEDVQFGAGEAPLLIVADGRGKKFELPFADAYLEDVDVGRRQIRMKLPEGLLEVNAPMTEEEKSEQRRLMQDKSMDRQAGGQSSVEHSRRTRRSRR